MNGYADVLNLNNLTMKTGSLLTLDAMLGSLEYDKIALSGTMTGNLNLAPLNIVTDLKADATNNGYAHNEVITPSSNATITVAGQTYTNDKLYEITPSSDSGVLDIGQYDITFEKMYGDSTVADKVYVADGNTIIRSELGTFNGDTILIDGGGYEFRADGTAGMKGVIGRAIIKNLGRVDENGDVIQSAHGSPTITQAEQ